MIRVYVNSINNLYRSFMPSLKITSSYRQTLYFTEKRFYSKKEDQTVNKINAAQELKDNWDQIYRFPKIKTIAALNKLKNYQLTATVFGMPLTYFFFMDHFFIFCYTGCSLVVTLSFLSYVLKDSIGFIYVNKKESDLVRIAYLNFWGSRRDSEFHIQDITPFSDLPKSITDKFYTKLKFNNGHGDLKLLSKEVEIIDYENFSRIFGE